MISKRHRFIFVHVPKTGGNSIQNILKDYSEDAVAVHDVPLSEIKKRLTSVDHVTIKDVTVDNIKTLERFGVDNRVLRTHKHSKLSEYRENWDTKIYGAWDHYFKFSIVRNPFERMISLYFSPHRGSIGWSKKLFNHMVENLSENTLEYFQIGTQIVMNYIMRFENLQTDFDFVCERLGIEGQKLPHVNKSSHKHYTDYYDDELRLCVYEKFKPEIDYFGYKFGS